MEKILKAIDEKLQEGYSINNLEVDYGCPDDELGKEGYYLSKLNGWGCFPITDILCDDTEVNDDELIAMLDKINVSYSI